MDADQRLSDLTILRARRDRSDRFAEACSQRLASAVANGFAGIEFQAFHDNGSSLGVWPMHSDSELNSDLIMITLN